MCHLDKIYTKNVALNSCKNLIHSIFLSAALEMSIYKNNIKYYRFIRDFIRIKFHNASSIPSRLIYRVGEVKVHPTPKILKLLNVSKS